MKKNSTNAPDQQITEDDDEKDMEQKLSTILHEHQTSNSTEDKQIKKIFSKYASKTYASFGKAGLKNDEDEDSSKDNDDDVSEASATNKWLSKAATRDAA